MRQILIVDWSTFLPDLIVGALTGGVVGLALYIIERRAAAASRKNEAKTVSRRLVHPLLLVLQRPGLFADFTSIVPIPSKPKQALQLIEAADVDLWHETAPSDLTTGLRRYRSALWDLETDAANLQDAVQRWTDIHTDSPKVAEYAIARLLDAPRRHLDGFFADSSVRASVEDEVDLMLDSKFVKKHASAYRGAINRVQRAQESLVAVLIDEMRDRSTRT